MLFVRIQIIHGGEEYDRVPTLGRCEDEASHPTDKHLDVFLVVKL